MARKQIKHIHEGQYVAEVEIELVDSDISWSPTMSLEDAYHLDDIRKALKAGDLAAAAKNARVYEMKRIAL